MIPLIPLLIASGLAAGTGSRLYQYANSGGLYAREAKAYRALSSGYSRHLARYGLSQNPNRSLTSGFYGKALSSDVGYRNQVAGAIGSIGNSIAGYGIGVRKLKANPADA